MNNSDSTSILIEVAFEYIPPLIRESLYEHTDFRQEYGLTRNALIYFGNPANSFRHSNLLASVRNVLSGVPEKKINDTNGRKWRLKNTSDKAEFPNFTLSRGKQRFLLPSFSEFSPNKNIRLRSLEKVASKYNLPSNALTTWHNILEQRPLENDELEAFQADIYDTPIAMADFLRSQFSGKGGAISSLVPPSRRYFERLVGVYDGSTSIQDYATGRGKLLIDELSKWRPYDGFLYSLLLSSHSTVTGEINLNQLSTKELVDIFNFLERKGDRTSQLGAIEVGMRILPSRLEIEQVLVRLIEQIRDDDVDGEASGFNLLSALFFLVDGELSRTRLLAETPPFYRRLATLSHAALIYRQLVNSKIDIDQFSEQVSTKRISGYYLQSLIDMRLEPCWEPSLSTAEQIKADFFGRIMNAAWNFEQNISDSQIYDLVLSNKPISIKSKYDSIQPFLPSPLEGTEGTQSAVPQEIVKIIESQLTEEKVAPTSFIALVNFALIHRIGTEQAELAADMLKLAKYRLQDIENRPQLIAILHGLAKVAAVARSQVLANELRILVRRYRYDADYALTIDEVINMCLISAASRPDLNSWAEFIGEWMTELAFSDLKDDEGQIFYSYLDHLCHIAPTLWVSCGRAVAAITAFNTK